MACNCRPRHFLMKSYGATPLIFSRWQCIFIFFKSV
jgi:hypothetical protein